MYNVFGACQNVVLMELGQSHRCRPLCQPNIAGPWLAQDSSVASGTRGIGDRRDPELSDGIGVALPYPNPRKVPKHRTAL